MTKPMKREIKFRAWDKDNDQFIPDYFTIGNDGVIDIIDCLERNKPCWPEEQFIVEQFTGLKDKNEVEIYEGDILWKFEAPNSKTKSRCKIGYVDDRFILEWITKSWFNDILRNHVDELEVIGNIHQNPELL